MLNSMIPDEASFSWTYGDWEILYNFTLYTSILFHEL